MRHGMQLAYLVTAGVQERDNFLRVPTGHWKVQGRNSCHVAILLATHMHVYGCTSNVFASAALSWSNTPSPSHPDSFDPKGSEAYSSPQLLGQNASKLSCTLQLLKQPLLCCNFGLQSKQEGVLSACRPLVGRNSKVCCCGRRGRMKTATMPLLVELPTCAPFKASTSIVAMLSR